MQHSKTGTVRKDEGLWEGGFTRAKAIIRACPRPRSAFASPRRPSCGDSTTEPNSIFGDTFIDRELPFVYEAELLSQFLRSDVLLTAFTADYVTGSAPPEILLSQIMSLTNKSSYVSRALLAAYHLYDGFWCLTVMPTECFSERSN